MLSRVLSRNCWHKRRCEEVVYDIESIVIMLETMDTKAVAGMLQKLSRCCSKSCRANATEAVAMMCAESVTQTVLLDVQMLSRSCDTGCGEAVAIVSQVGQSRLCVARCAVAT